MLKHLTAIVAASLAIAACQPVGTPTVQNDTQAESLPPPAVPAESPPKAGTTGKAAAKPSAKVAARTAPPPKPVPRFNPEALIGMNERETQALLGAPSSVRDQPPAKVWTYAAADCELNVIFYLDLESRLFRALNYEVDSKTRTQRARQDCISEVATKYLRKRS